MCKPGVLNEQTSWQARLGLVETCLPELLHNPGRVLYIGARPARMQLMKELVEGGAEVTVLEAWQENVAALKGHPWIFHSQRGDVRNLDNIQLPHLKYDTIVWWHGPEHVLLSELSQVLAAIERRASQLVVLGCPWGVNVQGATEGNPFEEHWAALEPVHFEQLGYETAGVGCKDLLWSHVMAWKWLT